MEHRDGASRVASFALRHDARASERNSSGSGKSRYPIIRENLARYVYSGSSRRRSSSALCRRDSSGTGAVAVRDVTARSRLVCRFDGESRGGDARCSRSSSDEDDESSYAGTGVRGGRRRSGADANGGGDEATDRAETRGDVANRGGSAVDVGSAVGAGSAAARRNANAGFGSFIPAGSSDAGPGAVGGFAAPPRPKPPVNKPLSRPTRRSRSTLYADAAPF